MTFYHHVCQNMLLTLTHFRSLPYKDELNTDLRMLEPWIKNPGGLDADNFIQSGSVVRGTYTYHRNILLLGL